jgi:hypothetical protein
MTASDAIVLREVATADFQSGACRPSVYLRGKEGEGGGGD